GYIYEIIPLDYDNSGRPQHVRINHFRGQDTMPINEFRLAVGPDLVRSTKDLTVEYLDKEIVFSGHGWGHGVGMCQWGAKALAEKGWNYKDILEYYYPGSTIVKMQNAN
ncbi:MAG: amidase, partial [Candidatus Omnitrophica bacterium]|nr:amidase [Candidatus Omnitrophota bacterium]